MSAPVFMTLLNKLGLRDKMPGFAEHFIAFFASSLMNSIIQDSIYHMALNMIKITLSSYF